MPPMFRSPSFRPSFPAHAPPPPAFQLLAHYHGQNTDALGVSTGWPSLDPYYKVVPGELTIVTGESHRSEHNGSAHVCCCYCSYWLWGAQAGGLWARKEEGAG